MTDRHRRWRAGTRLVRLATAVNTWRAVGTGGNWILALVVLFAVAGMSACGAPSGHAATAGSTAWRGRCLSLDRGTDEDVVYATTRADLVKACGQIAEHPVVYQQTEVPCGLGMPGCPCVGHAIRAVGGINADFLPGSELTLCDGRKFILQPDGNLVLYGADGKPLWATWTYAQSVSRLVMQADGNLVLYDREGKVIWMTDTSGNPGAFLAIQEDGNVVLYDQAQHVLWSTGTSGK